MLCYVARRIETAESPLDGCFVGFIILTGWRIAIHCLSTHVHSSAKRYLGHRVGHYWVCVVIAVDQEVSGIATCAKAYCLSSVQCIMLIAYFFYLGRQHARRTPDHAPHARPRTLLFVMST